MNDSSEGLFSKAKRQAGRQAGSFIIAVLFREFFLQRVFS
jgi:hypothetical protein